MRLSYTVIHKTIAGASKGEPSDLFKWYWIIEWVHSSNWKWRIIMLYWINLLFVRKLDDFSIALSLVLFILRFGWCNVDVENGRSLFSVNLIKFPPLICTLQPFFSLSACLSQCHCIENFFIHHSPQSNWSSLKDATRNILLIFNLIYEAKLNRTNCKIY